jgi:hypothetical protein
MIIISVVVVMAIGLYATWLLVERVRKGEHKGRSFREWLKNMFEAVWGL